jgi:hypothetical protein
VVALVVRRWLPARWEPAVQACPYLFLALLGLVSLFFFVVPQLAL